MTNALCIDEKYSTTKLATKEKPSIENGVEDKFETVLFLPEGENRKGEGGLRTKGYFKKSYEGKPLVSIVTVVFNGEKYLEETIRSVINQSYDNVEYIIIDGGSNDGTVDIIGKYEDKIDYWVSEADGGIYDAMNKGIATCSGEIIGIVNADDVIYNRTLSHVVSMMRKYPNVRYVYGTVDLATGEGDVYGHMRPLTEKELNKRLYSEMPFPHPSLYVKSNVYKEIGLYNSAYRLSADYDFVLTLIEKKIRKVELLQSVGFFRDGGQSGEIQSFLENKNILLEHNVNIAIVYKNFLKSYFKMTVRKIVPDVLFLFIKKFRKKSKNVLYE